MAEEKQPPTVVEGATTGDIEDEIQQAAKSAEDRKAAAALSKLDTHDDESAASGTAVDQEAVKNAMNSLGGAEGPRPPAEVKKTVKINAADVKDLVAELDLSKEEATKLLRAHDGDLAKATSAHIRSEDP